MADTGVVFLYRFAEGEAPVRRFLASYGRHPAGLAHDLHVVLKGFPTKDAFASACALFRTFAANVIDVDDGGYDIGSYLAAARAVANRQLIFLNTFSEILADNWLTFFDRALAMPCVGLVGATGSWQSATSGYEARFFNMLRRLNVMRRDTGDIGRLVPVPTAATGITEGRRSTRPVWRKLLRATLYPHRLYQFGRHPNPHIRTNAFMIQRDVFLSLRPGKFRSKMDAYKFESGRHSLTRQIMTRGLRPIVVDRYGRVYNIQEWKSSSTFWIDFQDNLLIADNQTTDYTAGDLDRRRILRNYAWENPWSW